MSSFSLSVGAYSHRGRIREKNDDHYLLASFVEQEALCRLVLPLQSRTVQTHGFLCAIADGMGGYQGGALASRVLLETLTAYFYSQPREARSIEAAMAAIEKALELARSALGAQVRREPQLKEAGSTLAGLVILADGTALPFHLGDSRILRWNAGFLRALTLDHNPLAADILAGRISETEAAQSPLASQISRSFGAETTSSLEWGEPLTLSENDLFLLVTDGCHGLGRGLSQRELGAFLNSFQGDEAQLANTLVERAVASDGSDNTTALVVRATCLPSSPFNTNRGNTTNNAFNGDVSMTSISSPTIPLVVTNEDELSELDPFAT